MEKYSDIFRDAALTAAIDVLKGLKDAKTKGYPSPKKPKKPKRPKK
jgi:hypothetical protein